MIIRGDRILRTRGAFDSCDWCADPTSDFQRGLHTGFLAGIHKVDEKTFTDNAAVDLEQNIEPKIELRSSWKLPSGDGLLGRNPIAVHRSLLHHCRP